MRNAGDMPTSKTQQPVDTFQPAEQAAALRIAQAKIRWNRKHGAWKKKQKAKENQKAKDKGEDLAIKDWQKKQQAEAEKSRRLIADLDKQWEDVNNLAGRTPAARRYPGQLLKEDHDAFEARRARAAAPLKDLTAAGVPAPITDLITAATKHKDQVAEIGNLLQLYLNRMRVGVLQLTVCRVLFFFALVQPNRLERQRTT